MLQRARALRPAAAQREGQLSKRARHRARSTIGVNATPTQRDAIAAAAQATMGAYLATGADRARAADDRLREVKPARQAKMAELRPEWAQANHWAAK